MFFYRIMNFKQFRNHIVTKPYVIQNVYNVTGLYSFHNVYYKLRYICIHIITLKNGNTITYMIA